MTEETRILNEIIANRRSVFPKSFEEGSLPDKVIENALENANWAPTHKRTYPWRFVVFKGEGRHELADWQSSLYKEISTQNGSFQEKRYEKLKVQPLKCSHVVAVIMKRDIEERIPIEEEIASVACAVQNIYLTAAANKVGMYWGTGGVTYFEEAKEYFGLGEGDKLMGFLYFGIVRPENWPVDKARKNWRDMVTWVGAEKE